MAGPGNPAWRKDASGKGVSGNPGGRPKEVKTVTEMARKRTVRAVQTLTSIMEDAALNPVARVRAAIALLDRGWGSAPKVIEVKRVSDLRGMTLEDIRRRREELIREMGGDDGTKPD